MINPLFLLCHFEDALQKTAVLVRLPDLAGRAVAQADVVAVPNRPDNRHEFIILKVEPTHFRDEPGNLIGQRQQGSPLIVGVGVESKIPRLHQPVALVQIHLSILDAKK